MLDDLFADTYQSKAYDLYGFVRAHIRLPDLQHAMAAWRKSPDADLQVVYLNIAQFPPSTDRELYGLTATDRKT